nr:hypothetical protein [Spirochaeta sp.]
VLRQFRPSIPTEDTAFLFVFNRNRGENADLERARASLLSIEAVHGLPCAGIINNTHMLSETTCDHLRAGDHAARELAAAVGVPVVYYAATAALFAECNDDFAGAPLTIGSVLRQEWMNTGNDHTNRR